MLSNPETPSAIPRSLELFQRAVEVIPGGIYGHTSPAAGLPGVFPYYVQSAAGCRFIDVDGREFIDYMCAYGPIVLGYHHPGVEQAAAAEKSRGSVFNQPAPVMVEFAEELVQRIDFAGWAVFAKNGSDVTTWALSVARQHTGRRKVFMLEGAYHGVDPWCTPGHGGVLAEDRALVHRYRWNDPASLESGLKEHGSDTAAVFITPYHHPNFCASELAAAGFLHAVQELCNRYGVVLILDDIRAGFRLHAAGSHRLFGFEPDMACYCKALGNGYPISAAVGRKGLQTSASQVFLTGSYWNNAEAMAAARTCLQVIERDDVPGRLQALGQRLGHGLAAAAANHGHEFSLTGPPACPYPVFQDDPHLYKIQEFCRRCAERGLFFHPHHNWFLSAAHDEATIDETVARADAVLAGLPAVVEG